MIEGSVSKLNPVQIKQAIAQCRVQLKDHPQPAEVYLAMGDLYAAQSKLTLAIKNYRQAIRLDQDFTQAHRQLAAVLVRNGNQELSANHLFRAYRLNPDAVTAQQHYELGQTLKTQNKLPRAIACYRAAIGSQSNFWDAYQVLARLLLEQGKEQRAVDLYRRGARNNPQDSRYFWALASIFASQQKWVRACNNYQRVAKLKPTAKVYYHWGLAQYALGDYALASSNFQTAAKLKPSAEIYYYWGLSLVEINQDDQARKCFHRTISLQNNYIPAIYQLGELWQKQQQWHQALSAYKQVQALKPEYNRVLIHINLGLIYRQLKEYDKSIACCQEIFDESIAKYSTPEILALSGYQQTSTKHYQLLAKKYYQLAKLLRAQGNFAQATAAYCQTIRLNPEFKRAYIDLQYTPNTLEQSTKLIQFYRQLLEQHPQITIAWGNLGDVLAQQERITEAIDCYRKGSYQQTVRVYPHLAEYDWQPTKKSGPDFIIAGAAKCGTSSLHQYLSRHPQILFPHKKELDFYWKNYQRGIEWYLAHFPTLTDRADFLTGEATPNYLRFPQVAQRIKDTFPQTKIIILLRNPVDRAISWHYHKQNSGLTKLDLATAIATEIDQLSDITEAEIIDSGYHNPDNIISSLYLYKIRPWIELLGREQILILKSEDFYLNPLENMQQVFQFLGLPDCFLDNYPKVNAGSYSQVDSGLRKTLSDYFTPHNRQLEEYLGVKFHWQ